MWKREKVWVLMCKWGVQLWATNSGSAVLAFELPPIVFWSQPIIYLCTVSNCSPYLICMMCRELKKNHTSYFCMLRRAKLICLDWAKKPFYFQGSCHFLQQTDDRKTLHLSISPSPFTLFGGGVFCFLPGCLTQLCLRLFSLEKWIK